MKRILFVCYGGGHVNMVIPVLRKLAGRGDIHCDVLGLTTAASVLRQAGFSPLGFADFLHEDDGRAREIGELLAGDNTSASVSREESVAYLGLSYYDLEIRYGVDEAADIYARKGRQGFLPITILERVITQLNPDLVVTTISPRAEQAAIMVARERGIPSLCLVDLFGRPSLRRASEPGYGSRVCVISERVRRWLLAAGRREDEVVVTGNPAFDDLGRGLAEQGRRLRVQRSWDSQKVILWASQVEPERNPFSGAVGDPGLPRRIELRLIEIVARRSDWRLVIRPHPNEPERVVGSQERVEISGREDHLHTLLQAVDVVVIMTSTVGLEARLLGKPLVSVDLSVFTQDTPYQEEGLSRGITDLDELENAIEVALAEGGSLPKGFPAPGGATLAILAQMDEMLAEGDQ